MLNNRYSDYHRASEVNHRKKHGQFFTHSEIASFMVDWVLQSGMHQSSFNHDASVSDQCNSIFDPAFGLGAFHDSTIHKPSVTFRGNEIDPHILDYWRSHNKSCTAEVELKDYLNSWGDKHDNIVCNPPYARFQHFDNRHEIFKEFENKMDVTLSGYTNIASAFLVKSIHELNKNGRLAYVMPLEFLNTGYGKAIKAKLIENAHLHSIIKLDCEKDVFPDVTTTVGIILYDSSRHHSHVMFHNVGSIAELKFALDSEPVTKVESNILDTTGKWMQYFDKKSYSVNHTKVIPLQHYGKFSRGIATGANDFFAIKPSCAKEQGIEDCVIPCITKSSQINYPVFGNRQYNDLMRSDSRVLLFSPSGTLSANARKYIKLGEHMQYNERYITKCRNPWYKVEQRIPSPILLNVFSRDSYKIILNRSDAVNLTCYHGFQPNMFGQEYVEKLFLYMASDAGRKVLSLSKRVYGRSLDKFEPNDLNNALVPRPEILDNISSRDVDKAVKHIEVHNKVPDELARYFETTTHLQQVRGK